MDITLRLEQPADYRTVEELTREAFWAFSGSCDEHLLAHKLRDLPSFVPELDFVAEVDGKLVGNIMYSKAKIVSDDGKEYEVLGFGPLSVLPEYQRQGVGRALMMRTIAEAKRLGYRAILFFGHPDYYPRFGFERAEEYHITTSSGTNHDAFMAMPLYAGALDGVKGRYYEDPVFELDAEEAEAFDKTFPHKEKRVLQSIDVLLEKLNPTAQASFKERSLTVLANLRLHSGLEISSWDGIGEEEKTIINATLKEYGLPPKVFTVLSTWPYVQQALKTGDLETDVLRLLSINGKEKTAEHCAQVAKTSIQLAKRFGLSEALAHQAAILHDCSAVIKPNDMFVYATGHNWDTYEAEEKYHSLLHQRLSAVVAKEHFGVRDITVRSAIACHTTLKANPSPYDMLLFLADKISWDQEGTPPFLDVVLAALDTSLAFASLTYIQYAMDNKTILFPHPWLLEAKDWLDANCSA